MTSELTEVTTPSEGREIFPKRLYPFVMSQRVIIKPQDLEIVQTNVDFRKRSEGHTGTIIPDEEIYIPEENNTE